MTQTEQSNNSARRMIDHAAVMRWHRRLGVTAALAIILSSLSGVLHPIMTRMQPEPAKLSLEHRVPSLEHAMPIGRVLADRNIVHLSDCRIVTWDGKSYYQISLPSTPRRQYFHLANGSLLTDGDRLYAEHLARQFVGEIAAPVRDPRIIESFDWEYPRINRLVPVWRIEFDRPDAMRAYVDTRTGRLGTIVDRFKAFSSVEFAILHRWQWLDLLAPWARLAILSLFLAAALAVVLSGCWIYLLRWSFSSARCNLRRVHRLWGISISLVSCLFLLSGGYHLLHNGLRGDSGERFLPPPDEFNFRELVITFAEAVQKSGVAAVETISLVKIGGQAYYRVQPAAELVPQQQPGHGHHDSHIPHGKATPGQVTATQDPIFVSARDGATLVDGAQRHAIEIGRRVTTAKHTGDVKMITHFDAEYGFAFKRLPVQRVAFVNGVNVFVDPSDSAVAAVVDDADRAEGWVFGYVHKFEWLVPLVGIDARDAIAMTLALLIAGAALLGLALFRQRARGSKTLPQTR